MRQMILFLIVIILATPLLADGGDFQVSGIIEVDSGRGIPAWSPNGGRIAYLDRRILYVADTLGAARRVTEFDLPGGLCYWLSDNEILVRLAYRDTDRVAHNRLVRINADSGETITIEQYRKLPGGLYDGDWFSRPEVSIEKHIFYRKKKEIDSKLVDMEEIIFPQPSDSNDGNIPDPEGDHILEWNDDQMYIINLTGTDFKTIAPKPEGWGVFGTAVLSPDKSFFAWGPWIYDLADSSYILMYDYITGIPDSLGFDGGLSDINPVPGANELLYDIDVLGKTSEIKYDHKLALFNLPDRTVTLFDDLDLPDGAAPRFSPDGRRIAYTASDKILIIGRVTAH